MTKINHEDEINAMSSVRLLEIEPKVGEEVVETVNIRTDSGYVLLENVDSEALQQDYNRILELQETMFEVDEDSMVAGVADALVEGEQQVEQVAATKSRRRRRAQTADPESLPSLQPPHEQLGGELHNRDLEIREAQGLRKGLEEKALSVSKLASHPRMNLLAKKATRVAINTSILLAVYCIVAYSAALALPVVYRL